MGLGCFFFGRFVLGLAVGIYSSVTPSYINEIAPDHLAGSMGSCHQVFVCVAIVITYVIGMLLPDSDGSVLRNNISWRLAMAGSLVLSAFQILMMMFVYKYDSPVFYVSNGMNKKVRENFGYR